MNLGNTPRQRQRGRGSKTSTQFISSRVIGVEVHCGPVHGTLLYYTDDLSKGGSNTIIEVTRQGTECVLIYVYLLNVQLTINAYDSCFCFSNIGLGKNSGRT